MFVASIAQQARMNGARLVSFVAASGTNYAVATSLGVFIPASVNVGDLLLAVIMRRSAMSAPSGWTLFDSQLATGGIGPIDQWIDIYTRTAQAGDAGSTVTFTQSASVRIGTIMLAFRSAGTPVISTSAKAAVNGTGGATTDIATVAATGDGEIAVATAGFIVAASGGGSVVHTVSSPWTLRSVSSIAENRLAVATRGIASPESADGSFTRSGFASDNNDGIGKITVILSPPP